MYNPGSSTWYDSTLAAVITMTKVGTTLARTATGPWTFTTPDSECNGGSCTNNFRILMIRNDNTSAISCADTSFGSISTQLYTATVADATCTTDMYTLASSGYGTWTSNAGMTAAIDGADAAKFTVIVLHVNGGGTVLKQFNIP
jgi:hypothetical protein